jgi:MinD-like ATPase involved in chromosome partitioning or flagellar assembly
MPDPKLDTEGRLRTLEVGQLSTQEAILSIRDSIAGIKDAMATIATLETHHTYTRESLGRAFVAINKAEKSIAALAARVVEIEKEIPPLVEARGWMVVGMLSLCGIVLGALVYIVIKVPH